MTNPQTARLAVLTEFPAYQSEKQLREHLTEVGLDLSELYFTYVYPGPNTGPLTTQDINGAIPDLIREFEALPNLEGVLMVGNAPMQALTGQRGGITKKQGTILPARREFAEALKGVRLIPSTHPSYVLRIGTPMALKQFQTVLGAFAQIGELPPLENAKIVDTREKMELAREIILAAERVAIDIEATPVSWWHEDYKLISMAVAVDSQLAYVFLSLYHPQCEPSQDYITEALEALERYEGEIVMHNGKYDRQALMAMDWDVPLTHDTMVAQYVLNPDQPKGLEHLSSMHLGTAPYKDVDYMNILDEDLTKIAEMNGIDAIRTLRLWQEHYRDALNNDMKRRRVYSKLLMPLTEALIKIELGGIPVDVDKLEDLANYVEDRVVEYREWFTDRFGKEFNPGSTKQLRNLLYTKLGLPVPHRTPTGDPSTDKAALAALDHPVVDKLLEYRKWRQRLGTFVEPWMENTRYGKLHPSYKPAFVKTGRMSSEKPNIQQVPKDPMFRSIFGGEPGMSIIELDYSQIELRIAAWLANETQMLRAYETNSDLHTQTAQLVLGDPSARQVGKILNFGLLYGAQPKKLQEIADVNYGMKLSLRDARKYHEGFFEAYPNLKGYHEKMIQQVHKHSFVESPIGRIRYLPEIRSGDFAARLEAERQAINTPIQSMASDVLAFKLSQFTPVYQETRIVATVHDSLIVTAASNVAEAEAVEQKRLMENLSDLERTFGIRVGVPMVVDYEISTHWGLI